MALVYGSNYKGKKVGKKNTAPTKIVDEDNPFEYGAAGRGEGIEQTGAIYQAASQMGKPMSEAERVLETEEGRSLVRSLGGSIPNPNANSSNVNLPVGKGKNKAPVARERRQPAMLSSKDGRSKVQQQDETLAYLSAQPDAYGLDEGGQVQTDSAGNQVVGTFAGRNVITGAPPQPKKQDEQVKGVKMIHPETEQVANEVSPNDIPNLEKQGYQIAEATGDALMASNPEVAALRRANQEIERETNGFISQIRQFMLTNDRDLKQQVRTLEQGYQTRANDMAEVNRRREQALQTLGIRLGSRWTGGMGGVFGGIIATEEREGVQRIAELEQAKNEAILDAKTAAREQNWVQYSKSVDMAKDANRQKVENIKKIGEIQAEENKKVQEERRQLDIDIAVMDSLQSGETDPMEIFKKVNFDEYGRRTNGIPLKALHDAVTTIRKPIVDAQKSAYDLALKNGAPASVIAAISTANTPEEAYAAIGEYGVDKLDREYKKAQIANIYSSIQDRNINNAQQSAAASMDPSQLVAYAQQYAATGKIPTGLPKGTFGMVSEFAREMPKNKGELIDRKTGVKPDAADALVNGYGALYSAIELSKQLRLLDEERSQGLIPATFGKVLGSKAQSQYMDLRAQIVDLLARARTGAALTASEEKHYASMLPGRVGEVAGFVGVDSDVRIDNFTSALSSDLKNKTNVQGWAINGISTINIDGTDYTIGDIITNEAGQTGRINADGSVTLIQ